MILNSIHLNNFRNYNNCSLTFSKKFNFLYGENGNGKTNVLEAISMLCYTRSFLQSSEIDCIKNGKQSFDIYGEFKNPSDFVNKVSVSYNKDAPRKDFKVNHEAVLTLSSFFGALPLIVLSPNDSVLVSGTPKARRQNFDLIISQFSKVYLENIKNLNRIIKHKNLLLRENLINRKYSGNELRRLIEIWNEKLVEVSVKIILKRAMFVEDFRDYLKKTFNDIVGVRYLPVLDYNANVDCVIENEESLFNSLNKSLSNSYENEVRRGISIVGPHRDFYSFKMNKDGEMFDVKNFASQGEKKTFVIALKFSEYMYLNDKLNKDVTGEPIILLDDLFSGIDKVKVEKISSRLTNFGQIFLTTTDFGHLSILGKYFNNSELRVYNIINGSVEEKNI